VVQVLQRSARRGRADLQALVDVVPVAGLWIDDVWYYGGSPETVYVQLVGANPHVTMHLADPWEEPVTISRDPSPPGLEGPRPG
jgi:hypothetical protein